MSEPFIGEIRIWACDFAPRNWAFCDGGLLPIASNTALYSIIGTMYGGDGRTTLGLPNLQGRAPMQWGRGIGLSNHIQGETFGAANVALTAAQIPQHDHIIKGVRDTGTSGAPDASLYMGVDRGTGGENIVYLSAGTSNANLADSTLAEAGNNEPHENMQPYLVMNYCIALAGTYPSRS